jgi:sulfur-carrier protein adenylyltransferase/sulfurtransferase
MGHDLPRAYLVIRRAPENAGQPAEAEELMVIGRSIQRFWLTATRLGLTMQPVLATLAFAHYGERQIQFSKEPGLTGRAENLARSFRASRGVSPEDVIFIARIGEPYPRLPTHRSGRQPPAELMS